MPNEELERARESLRRSGLAMAILAAPANICYVSGVDVPLAIDAGWEFAEGQPLVVLSTRDDRAILLCPDLWMRLVERGNRIADTRAYATVSFEHPIDNLGAFLDALRGALRDVGAAAGGVIGVEPRYLPQRVAALLGREFASLQVRDATETMNEARLVKTEREIALIRRAVAAADAGQEYLRQEVDRATGLTEVELYAGVHAAVHRAAGGPASIVGELVTGPRTSVVRYPGGPIDRRLERGDTVIQDISVRVNGYWSDCTNTLVVAAEPSAKQQRYFRAARRAFEATVEALRPGTLTGEAVAAARRVFLSEGFDFTPYCGHQIGAAVNELPRLVIYDRTPVQAGMVFAVEPGVYGGEELGIGARAERVVVVRESGNEILSAFRWGMEA